MKQRNGLLLGVALGLLLHCASLSARPSSEGSHAQLSITDLESEIAEIQDRLQRLPQRLIRESGGTLGFRSQQKEGKSAWVEVDLEERKQFDAIVLVPAVSILDGQQASNEMFPRDFEVWAYASAEDMKGQLLYDSMVEPLNPFPDRSPAVIHCPGTSAQRVRVVAFELFPLPHAPLQSFALSELLIFNGNQNLALGKAVDSEEWTQHSPIWHKSYLTDGYMPYSEPSQDPDGEVNCCRMHIAPSSSVPPSITVDLGQEHALDEIRLYPANLDPNTVVFHKTALGFPKRFKIEVSSDAAFTAPTVVYKVDRGDYPSPGHRMASFSAKSASGRYVRITATRLPAHPTKRGSIFALAEVEVVAEGEVVSRAAYVQLSHPIDIPRFPVSMLVDGIASGGTILPLRSWLFSLEERNRLENQLATLQEELKRRYLHQSRIAHSLRWAIGSVLLLALLIYLWQRQVRQHQLYRLRETLAADLHDEIGGNFSGIALLSDELAHERTTPEDHIPRLHTIAEISRNSAGNTRALVRFLESRKLNGELADHLNAAAEVLLLSHKYSFVITGKRYLSKLEPKDQWHLLLFFKESLNNIVKHADATEVEIHLRLSSKELSLTIHDNGRGLPQSGGRLPAHLSARAQKLKAKLNIGPRMEGGTKIQLDRKL